MEWERALTPALSGDAFIVRAQAGHVFVGGRTSDGTSQQIAVLALHAGTGLTEWIHVSDGAGPGTGGVIFSLVASANDLFVAGDAGGSSHVDSSVFVRSLSRGEGAVLWETVIPFATTFFLTECLEAGSGLAFVCGSHHVTGATNDFMVRAYDARTGELRWADRPDDGGLWSSAAALTLSRGRLVVVGLSDCDFAAPTPGCRLAVRAYDAATGVLAWQDLASDHASVEDVVTDGEFIFVAAGETVPTIRAYDAETGALVWVDRADGRIGAHLSLTVDDHWLFAGGFIRQNLSIISPYVRALSLKPVPAPR